MMTESQSYVLTSSEEDPVAEIELHADGLQLTVTYLVLLTSKQPQWYEDHQASTTS
jgi:hypothetical protein